MSKGWGTMLVEVGVDAGAVVGETMLEGTGLDAEPAVGSSMGIGTLHAANEITTNTRRTKRFLMLFLP
jgi:predicted MFS family arabinose efflux permease